MTRWFTLTLSRQKQVKFEGQSSRRGLGGCKSPWRWLTIASNVYQKGKGSPYSITERRVQELIPVLGSQPAGDLSQACS